METDPHKKRALLLNIECINVLNEGLLIQHAAYGCPKPKWSKYLSFLRSKTFAELSRPKPLNHESREMMNTDPQTQVEDESPKYYPKIHTIFSTECSSYFDWQTVGLVHSFHQSGQPGNITRLLSCTEEDLKQYKGHHLAPTHYVPSMSRHPLTGDWYPAINKPAAVVHWLNHVKTDAEYIVILDADMIMRGPITPWEFNAAHRRPVSTPYGYLIGCDNELAKLHTRHPEACDKVGGVIIMHINDLRRFALLWLHKTEEVRADTSHWSKNITGDVYESGWISEMYGYSFGAAELDLRHAINNDIMIYPGYVPAPGVRYRVFHYGLEFRVGNWSFDKANWRHTDVVNTCWAKFPEPPDAVTLDKSNEDSLRRDLLSIECVKTLNEALRLHHVRSKCPNPSSLRPPSTLAPPKLGTGQTPIPRKFGKVDEIHTVAHNAMPKNDTEELSPPTEANQTFKSVKFWIIALWAICIFGFVAVMSLMLSGRRGQKKRGKSYKGKRRTSYSSWDTNGEDRHL